jgi:hypothetical protein
MRLFFELLTLGLLAGIVYFLRAIAADFKAIRRSELPLVIGELKTANRIGYEILAVVSRTGTPPTHPPHDPRSFTTQARRGDMYRFSQSEGEFMVWCWRDSVWQPLSVPPGFQPGPPPEFDGNYEGEAVSVWLPRPES